MDEDFWQVLREMDGAAAGEDADPEFDEEQMALIADWKQRLLACSPARVGEVAAGINWAWVGSASMTELRADSMTLPPLDDAAFQKIMSDLGASNSRSLHQALRHVANWSAQLAQASAAPPTPLAWRPMDSAPRKMKFQIAYRAARKVIVSEAMYWPLSERMAVWRTPYSHIEVGSPDIIGWQPMAAPPPVAEKAPEGAGGAGSEPDWNLCLPEVRRDHRRQKALHPLRRVRLPREIGKEPARCAGGDELSGQREDQTMTNPTPETPAAPQGGDTMKTIDGILEWLMDRSDNCTRIAEEKSGSDRVGWQTDALYFLAAAKLIADAYQTTEEAHHG